MKKKTKKINWEKGLLVLGILIVLVGLIDMTYAHDNPNYNIAHIHQQNQETIIETKTVESFGLALRTQYGFDGKECVKRDLMSKPAKLNQNAVFPESWIKSHRTFEWQGDIYGYRIFPAKRARAFEKIEGHLFGGMVMKEAICDKTKIETSPLPVFWWRNSYDSNLYFQIHTIGFPHEIPFFNKVM